MTERAEIELGSGNVFADLGFPNPEEHLAKAELTLRIMKVIRGRGLSQAAAARLLGLGPSRLASLLQGRVGRVTVDRLRHFLSVLSSDETKAQQVRVGKTKAKNRITPGVTKNTAKS